MNRESLAMLAGGVASYIVLRLADYIFPPGRRFRWLDRWTADNDDEEEEP